MIKMPRVIQCEHCERILEQPLMEDAGECCRLTLAMAIISWVRECDSDFNGLDFDLVLEKLQEATGEKLPDYLKDMIHRMIVGTFLAEVLQIDFELILREANERFGE